MAAVPALLAALLICAGAETTEDWTLDTLTIRDPFVMPVEEQNTYYLYGTGWPLPGGPGFVAYTSKDLRTWAGPHPVFEYKPGFWATRDYWAPEVHRHKDRYYLFGTFKPDGRRRGTQILVADSPLGPFAPHGEGPVTPEDWECLDGTLYVDESGTPWMVFCHEWLQIGDGAMCAVRLTEDLKRAAGEPVTLFHGSDAPWATPLGKEGQYVTDGPFLHRTAQGELLMFWSTFGSDGYGVAVARSESGKVTGPWTHDPAPLFSDDGGHCMLFRAFDGRLMMSLHAPNRAPEQLRLFHVDEKSGRFSPRPFPAREAGAAYRRVE